MGRLYYGDAVKRLENAGYTTEKVTYGRTRKETDIRTWSVTALTPIAQTLFAHEGTFNEAEVNNVCNGLHKYAGMSFAGREWPADAKPE